MIKDIYLDCKEYHKKLTETILKENSKLIKNEHYEEVKIDINVEKSVIPFIESDPQTNFITISNVNLFTQDDPILRYIPTIKNKTPKSISWYEGTIIGEKPFTCKEMIEKLFVDFCIQNDLEKEAMSFLNKQYKKPVKIKMTQLFCNVCLLFNCGIHVNLADIKVSGRKIKPVAKYDEPLKCVCRNNFNNKNLLNENIDFKLLEYLKKSNLNSCVLKSIFKGFKHSQKTLIPIKSVKPSLLPIVVKEFYNPCSHDNRCCNSNCSCVSKEVSCELSCSCVKCSKIRFCNCKIKCEKDCVCIKNNRECIVGLCGCCFDSKRCNNFQFDRKGNTKKLSVFKSPYHCFGLFSDEIIIKQNEFVIEYTGEIITDKEAERRGNFYEINNCSYLFNLVNEGTETLYSIDAFVLGNKSRYINNSSKKPNLKAEIRIVNGMIKIGFLALRDIYKGEELLFDYNFTEEQQRKHGIIE